MGGFVLGLVATISRMEEEITVVKNEKDAAFHDMEQALTQLESLKVQSNEFKGSIATLKAEIAKLRKSNQSMEPLGTSAVELAKLGGISSSASRLFGISQADLAKLSSISAADLAKLGSISSSASRLFGISQVDLAKLSNISSASSILGTSAADLAKIHGVTTSSSILGTSRAEELSRTLTGFTTPKTDSKDNEK